MTTQSAAVMKFDQPDLLHQLESLDDAALDRVGFGAIGFDSNGLVRRYNAHESRASGLPATAVLGQPLLTDIAQCMNNYLVAQRFEDAASNNQPLDETIDFVLTWRMRPTKVKLRMLWAPGVATRYVLLHRLE